MSTIVTRSGKGSPLTHTEVDNNFTNLNTDKLQSGDTASSLTITSADINGGTIDGATIGASSASTGAFTSLSASGAFSANGGATLGDASGDALTINSSAVSIPNGLNFDSNTLVIDATNNRVGVGLTSPAYAFDAEGDFRHRNFGGGTLSGFFSCANTGSVTLNFGGTTTPNKGRIFYSDNSDLFSFFTNSTERMRIDSSGNVGIGTSSPSQKLDVNGTATANDFILKTDTNGLLTLGRFSSGYTWSLIRPSSDSSGFEFRSFSGTQWMTLNSSGNLGLGVIPSAWSSSSQALQNSDGAIWRFPGSIYFGQNYFFNGTNRIYSSSNLATQYEQRAGEHRFFTAPSGTAGNAITFTQAMTLDASGNLGIGTTSPIGRLDVVGNYVYLKENASGAEVYLRGYYGSANVAAIQVTTNSPLAFATSNAERMRIDSSGNLLVGTTTQVGSAKQTVKQGSLFFNGDGIAVQDGSSTTGGAFIGFFQEGGTKIGSISRNGASTVAYNTSSDYRLKDNIAPMTGALAKISALKPVTYKWKSDGSDGQGFIAHELAEVAPDCVAGEKDAIDEEGNPKYQGIDTSFLVATLTAAIQELKAEVDALKAQINQ
jgi:hypothetical protein